MKLRVFATGTPSAELNTSGLQWRRIDDHEYEHLPSGERIMGQGYAEVQWHAHPGNMAAGSFETRDAAMRYVEAWWEKKQKALIETWYLGPIKTSLPNKP